MWKEALLAYDSKTGVNWAWQSMDGTMTKAPLGGERTGPNPTDRGKSGVKRSLLTDGRGVPLGVVVAPANRNACKLVEGTLDARPFDLPEALDRGSAWTRVTTSLRWRRSLRPTGSRATYAVEERLLKDGASSSELALIGGWSRDPTRG